jgi:hypothetical protein
LACGTNRKVRAAPCPIAGRANPLAIAAPSSGRPSAVRRLRFFDCGMMRSDFAKDAQ